MSNPSILPLLGFVNPRGQLPSFLIPLFGREKECCLQDVGGDGRLIGFLKCDSEHAGLLSAPSRTLKIGDAPLYAFAFETGEIHVGAKEELSEVLRTHLRELQRFPFVRLEVAEFLGDEIRQREAVLEAGATLAKYDPEIAKQWVSQNGGNINPPPTFTAGHRVINRDHPESGFGIVKLLEEDAFGDLRCLVAFEHIIGTLPVTVSQLDAVGQPHEDLANGVFGDAGTFARKLSAALIVQENNRSGSFMRTAVEPLPHQAFVLEKVWGGGRFGHLLADDVGLGKTIEAGLIICSQVQQRPDAKILVICPAGVALQWQDEMEEHFGLYFSVLGRDSDFRGKSPQSWRGRNLVITPIDRIKRDEYKSVLGEVGPFDLVVCDEAHRLTAKRDFLSDLRTTANYRLVKELVDAQVVSFVSSPDGTPRSPRLLLLSATPHQGDDLRFAYLLGLIRPDYVPSPEQLASAPVPFSILQECVSRTPKSHAVSWDRQPIFKGHRTTTVEIHWTEPEVKLSQALTQYIESGFSQGTQSGRCSPLVIALVMHTFHKLAASSWVALSMALRSRLKAIDGQSSPQGPTEETMMLDESEAEIAAAADQPKLFDTEPAMLRRLITMIDALPSDSKWRGCEELLEKIENRWQGRKVLFFTQYRATQDLLVSKLALLFPGCPIAQLNGEMGLEQRREARLDFEGTARFLVSTEAGGEGINLQRACHLMVNYDVTWNPMRMQQRIGRLDRYGQKEHVEVFNLRVPESWDHRIFARIEERLKSIQATMGIITADAEDYREMILGVIADQIDERQLFAEQHHTTTLDEARIDEILKRAIGSAEKWKSLLRGELGFTPDNELRRPAFGAKQFERTYSILLSGHDVRMQRTKAQDNTLVPGVFHFIPPAHFREPSVRATKERYLVFDRALYAEARGKILKKSRGQSVTASLAGFGEPLTNWLFEKVFEARPAEGAFCIEPDTKSWKLGDGVLVVASLRWLGTARRMRAPDSVVGCFLAASGTDWIRLDEGTLMALALSADGGPVKAVTVDVEPARKIVQAELRDLVEARNRTGRASADWFWMLAAAITCKNRE